MLWSGGVPSRTFNPQPSETKTPVKYSSSATYVSGRAGGARCSSEPSQMSVPGMRLSAATLDPNSRQARATTAAEEMGAGAGVGAGVGVVLVVHWQLPTVAQPSSHSLLTLAG